MESTNFGLDSAALSIARSAFTVLGCASSPSWSELPREAASSTREGLQLSQSIAADSSTATPEGVLADTDSVRDQWLETLRRGKEYRDAFVSEDIDNGIPFQIRALREKSGWTQAELGRAAGMAQARISLLEDPNYARLNLATLKRLAAAFDVALLVKFVPFSELVERSASLSPSSLTPVSFDEDSACIGASPTVAVVPTSNTEPDRHLVDFMSSTNPQQPELGTAD